MHVGEAKVLMVMIPVRSSMLIFWNGGLGSEFRMSHVTLLRTIPC
jgi:hypothetical protein